MASIKREIETLRAKILRLEKEQKKAEQQQKALDLVQGQIDKTLKDSGLTFEAYIRSNYAQISRIMAKIEKARSAAPVKQAGKKKAVSKKRAARKAKTTIKIPAGSYHNLPADPERVFEVKEKGPRPKALKAYAEEVGLEAFLKQCRKDG